MWHIEYSFDLTHCSSGYHQNTRNVSLWKVNVKPNLKILVPSLMTMPRMLCNGNGAISYLQTERDFLRTSADSLYCLRPFYLGKYLPYANKYIDWVWIDKSVREGSIKQKKWFQFTLLPIWNLMEIMGIWIYWTDILLNW